MRENVIEIQNIIITHEYWIKKKIIKRNTHFIIEKTSNVK